MNNFKEEWEKNIKEFKKQSKFNKVVLIIFLLFILVGFVAGIYLSSILIFEPSKIFFKEYILELGYDFLTPITIFFLIGMGSSIIFVIINNFYKLNKYFLIGFYLFLFLLIFGICFTSETYKSSFEKELNWNQLNLSALPQDCNISNLKCGTRFDEFIVGQKFWCNFEVNRSCNLKYELELEKFYNNDSKRERLIDEKGFNFEITTEIQGIYIFLEIINTEGIYLTQTSRYIDLKNKYTLEEYHKRQHDKTLLIMTILSISLFSVIVAMNNLKQLFEKNGPQKIILECPYHKKLTNPTVSVTV